MRRWLARYQAEGLAGLPMLPARARRPRPLVEGIFVVSSDNGDPPVRDAENVLSSVRGRARWQRQHDLAFRRARKKEYAAQQGRMHLVIVYAIAARDPAAARQAMFDHLSAIRAIMVQETAA